VYIIVFIALSSASASLAGPTVGDDDTNVAVGHLSLDSCHFDFGVINADTIVEGSMRFRNTGTAPLQILAIFSECGCTTSSYTTDAVEPGESGEIKISFDSKNRRPGPFRKTLRIRSNADNPRVMLTVKGTI
ncbi:MAG: DUF1573 domain-containing protein, partial [Muribaculaceae bacterium]|nr:DUF1573 domain-containing protein [Muribaculaceae bacterium]